MLEKLHGREDLLALKKSETAALCEELRKEIVKTVSRNGGHLSSNLGVVELTVALHRVYDSPKDKIVFDVGHQCYAHKLLTGRYENFATLRKKGGVSGFPNPSESEHDVMYEGHSGTSVSAALGIATANKLQGKPGAVVAVVGDGSLTNGMIYEALNNCESKEVNLVIVLNDNGMSISKNTGGLSRYLSRTRVSRRYGRFKNGLEKGLSKIPILRKPLIAVCRAVKRCLKHLFVRRNLFEDLGIVYLGTVNGHNVKKMENVLRDAKAFGKVCIVHVCTKKGKGYAPAEAEPELYHGVGPFDEEKGVIPANGLTFSDVSGKLILKAAKEDEKIAAITAAMGEGTGLIPFSETYPKRYFDVGIAEEHAVTFAAGLAKSGMKPVVVLYSTFIQRTYDQLFQDVALQEIPLTVMVDRTGLVAGDGVTHQGIFDYPLYCDLPGAEVYAPATYQDMEWAFACARKGKGLSVIRYPKGGENATLIKAMENAEEYRYTANLKEAETVAITYGRLTETVLSAVQKRGDVGVISLKKILPLDYTMLSRLTEKAKRVVIYEEGTESGGVAEKLAAHCDFKDKKVVLHGIRGFVRHGDLPDLMHDCGLDEAGILADLERE